MGVDKEEFKEMVNEFEDQLRNQGVDPDELNLDQLTNFERTEELVKKANKLNKEELVGLIIFAYGQLVPFGAAKNLEEEIDDLLEQKED